MSPHGNGPPIITTELSHKFSILSANDDSLKNACEVLNKCRVSVRKEKVCVVSIIGKSSLDAKDCKAALIDESIGKNVFRGMFCEIKSTFGDMGCQIEGYYDVRNNVIFLHLSSVLDSHALTQISKIMEKEIMEKGFLQVWPDLQINLCKSLLLLFHISHIVVVVNPSPHFDLSYINLFRILDSSRQKLQPFITDMLESFSSLPSDWVTAGRPCSPRTLFVFESYGDKQFITKENVSYCERNLEEQIYRILRKSRVITNISGNSLFAVCAHNDYVYISTKDPTIRDPSRYLMERLVKYCNIENNSKSDSDDEDDDSHSFYSFLWNHIFIALSKGFDDNIGRHAAPPIFELPTVKEFFQVVLKLKEMFFSLDNENNDLKAIFNSIHNSLDIDTRFSEARCAKVLPIAMSIYQDGLPPHYTRDFHERKQEIAVQHFSLQARGPALYDYVQQLRIECLNYWQNSRQMCEVLSLTGNHCINPIHRLKQEDDSDDDSDSEAEQLPSMRHCSSAKIISACDCGRRQANREDPFTVKAANFDFYATMKNKCSCGHLERILFPVFEPSTDDIQPAITVPITRSPVSCKAANSLFDSSLSPSDMQFESQPDAVSSFTNLSQHISTDINTDLLINEFSNLNNNVKEDDVTANTVEESDPDSKTDPLFEEQEQLQEQLVKQLVEDDNENTSTSSEDNSYQAIDETDRENDIQLVIRESMSPYAVAIHHQSSTTEYLPGMLHSLSPVGLLPKYSSWSLVNLGPSSLYSHNMGLQDQPGFINGANFLLPWDVTVKLEHSGHLPPLWEGKRPPGIKNKKTFKDGTQFTVKIFIGVEYECHRGHRFICSGPDMVLKANMGIVKESANRVASNDMPLYFTCVCNRQGKANIMAQLMRIHIVTPKAPVNVTLNPRVQPTGDQNLIFYPGNSEPVRLSQSAYWILRLPMIYEGDQGPISSPKEHLPLGSGKLLKGMYGIADYISKPKLN